MTDIVDQVALGKKKGVVHDPRTFHLRQFMEGLPDPPDQSYVGREEPIRMYGNDRYGSCTCTAHGHRIDVQEKSARQDEIQLSTEDVLRVYSAVTGFDPDDWHTDNGAYMLDINNYMVKTGMGREADGTTHKIGAYAKISLNDVTEWKVASWMFGGVYFGAWLPLTAADQINSGKNYWRVEDGERAEPGSWGGHAMHALGYSSGSIVLATWGQRLRATWEWLATYCDEAYVLISEDFLRSGGETPHGFNVDELNSMLLRLVTN